MEIPLLADIVVIFSLSIVVIMVFQRLRIPTIVGFLLTGVLAGPHGFGLISAVHEVELMAEIGVVLLLFTIGIEFSLESILRIKKSVLLGGSLQVLLTIIVAFGIAKLIGLTTGQAVFAGFLLSLSSTVIVLKLLQEKAEVDSPHGKTSLAILIFQDIMIVPMMLFIPIMSGAGSAVGSSPILFIAKAAVVVIVLIVSARLIIPVLFFQIAKTKSRELFLLAILTVCFAIAWITSSVGLSLALGAFLAGLIVSESEYSHWALGNIIPFRDVFTSFFFISIGMLLNLKFAVSAPVLILSVTVCVLLLKTLTSGVAALLLGLPIRTTILVAVILSQVGEFSFILSRVGLENGLFAGDHYQIFLSVTVLTMIGAPFIISLAPRISTFVSALPFPERIKGGAAPIESESVTKVLKDHLVIIGFGLGGRNLARAARVAKIPYTIIEMNVDTVKSEREKGEPIFFGDAVYETSLDHVGISGARVVVIVISDPMASRRVISAVRGRNPSAYIIARTRFNDEIKPLRELGADEVITEEFEASIEIFTTVLTKYLIPRDEIKKFSTMIRAEGYEMLRSPKLTSSLEDLSLHLSDVEICSLRVSENSFVSGKTPAEILLRSNYGVNLLAINRDSKTIANPDADTVLHAGDVLIVMGSPEQINNLSELTLAKDK
ncbi:MAG: cation:proton antiporter [Thermodesulfobacteriota bacterium]